MKRFFGIAIIILSLSMSAFAAKNTKDITFENAVKVGTTQVPAGNYKVSWTGTDASMQVTVSLNGKVLATAAGKQVAAKNGFFSLGIDKVNGAEILQAIQLEKSTIELAPPTAAGE